MKDYCPICNEDMDEVEYTQFKMCLKCFEKKVIEALLHEL